MQTKYLNILDILDFSLRCKHFCNSMSVGVEYFARRVEYTSDEYIEFKAVINHC